ncbi:unnamed protein product [Cylicostephanus goldi]|uniref:Uncharacterized protein n=1 Tax=Cylicostephanus goldi TaxID=71465 RepID=A0A3P7Q538_CYLGO|nr:unnamed protein product [Cylicostephanus goldi]
MPGHPLSHFSHYKTQFFLSDLFLYFLAVTANATWSGWSQWSACSATCGESTQKRYRFCENPEPKRAPDCVGDMIETRPCVVPECPGIFFDLFAVNFKGPRLITGKLKAQPLLANCSCGCVLSGTAGSFFATAADAQVCAGNQTWSMPARHNKIVADFKVVTDDEAPGKLFFFLRAPYEEFTLRLDRAIFIVLWYKGNNSELMERKGYTISYSTRGCQLKKH